MQLEQAFELPFPRDAVWTAFRDIPMLVSCLPGAMLTSSPDANPLAFIFSVKLGPISANFAGQGSVTYDDDCTGRLTGTGADRGTNSRVKGDAKFVLQEIENGTRVQVLVDYTLTGALAQFGRPGIVKELAANITQQFAANWCTQLDARASMPAAKTAPAKAAAPAQLDAGGLLLRVLWGRVKRLFGLRSS